MDFLAHIGNATLCLWHIRVTSPFHPELVAYSTVRQLGNLFAVAVHGYAVMSNHVHVVVEVDPNAADEWSEEEVARRWLSLGKCGYADALPFEDRVDDLAGQTARLVELRRRLGSLSWFMRFLKEPIARQANREDECTGWFWEGRFDSQDLREDPSILTCMVYVDLNPMRAGTAETPAEGPNTSLGRRINLGVALDAKLEPIAAGIRSELLELSLRDYIEIVNWTATNLSDAPALPVCDRVSATLEMTGMRPIQWLQQVPVVESCFSRAIGSSTALVEFANDIGQRWVRGIGTARALEKMPDPFRMS